MLLLRALVPSGFMLAQVDGGLSLVLCEAEAMTAGPHTTGHHHHAGALHSGHDSDPSFHGDTGCPYAQSGAASLLPTLPRLAGTAPALSFPAPPRVAQTITGSGPPRQQSPRGPPALA